MFPPSKLVTLLTAIMTQSMCGNSTSSIKSFSQKTFNLISSYIAIGVRAGRSLSLLVDSKKIKTASLEEPDFIDPSFIPGTSGFLLKAAITDALKSRNVLSGHTCLKSGNTVCSFCDQIYFTNVILRNFGAILKMGFLENAEHNSKTSSSKSQSNEYLQRKNLRRDNVLLEIFNSDWY